VQEISRPRNVDCAYSRGQSWNSFSIKYIFMFFEFSTIYLATVDMTSLGRLPSQRLLGKGFGVEHRFFVWWFIEILNSDSLLALALDSILPRFPASDSLALCFQAMLLFRLISQVGAEDPTSFRERPARAAKCLPGIKGVRAFNDNMLTHCC